MTEQRRFGALDTYARRARLAPALLVVLPVCLTVIAWAPDAHIAWATLLSLVATAGVTILVAELVRDTGKRKEVDLIVRWDGLPSVRLLRHRDDGNEHTRARRHRSLEKLIPGTKLPTREDELSAPQAADRAYESCVQHLRERTRDREQFSLLFEENTSYGFRRNLWAMRASGIAISACAVAVSAASLFAGDTATRPAQVGITATLANACLLAAWLFRVTPEWVYEAAISYSERLLGACEVLASAENEKAKERGRR